MELGQSIPKNQKKIKQGAGAAAANKKKKSRNTGKSKPASPAGGLNQRQLAQVMQAVKGQNAKSVVLSECAARYMSAISRPWDHMSRGACIPRFPARPSAKRHAFARFTVNVGGSTDQPRDGYGMIMVFPTTANDQPCVIHSANNGGFAPTSAVSWTYKSLTDVDQLDENMLTNGGDDATDATPLVVARYNNSPTSANDLTATVDANASSVVRLVSCSMSIECTTPDFYVGGTLFQRPDPSHANMNDVAPATLGNLASCKPQPIVKKKIYRSALCGIDDEELTYPSQIDAVTASGAPPTRSNPNIYPFSSKNVLFTGVAASYTKGAGVTDKAISSSKVLGGAPLVVILEPSPSTTQTASFVCEMDIIYEDIGLGAQFQLTPNVADPAGFSAVNGAAQDLPAMKAANPGKSDFTLMKDRAGAALNAASGIATKVTDFAHKNPEVTVRAIGAAMSIAGLGGGTSIANY